MKLTPHRARFYLLLAAFFVALPSLGMSYKGQTGRILVASQDMKHAPFAKSIVRIEQHNLFQAYGFILNKPLSSGERQRLFPDGGPPDVPIYYGGPVGYPAVKNVMHRDGTVADYDNAAPFAKGDILFLGYAGWTVLQLDYEIGRGVWDVIDEDPAIVWESPPATMWDKARLKIRRSLPVRDRRIL